MKKPEKEKAGNCVHLRLSRITEQAFRSEAEKMKIPLATYLKSFVEIRFREHGLLRYGK
jgi:hypothetical protein